MGAKIITEKDFWMCSSGAVPAQLQGTRLGTKKASGEIYITVQDTSSASWIDFGCTKLMMLYALIAAAAVVAAVVIGVLTVATGGAALVLLCMAAAAVAAVVGAVVGGLICGQLMNGNRTWSASKSNFISQGVPTITGAHQMTCNAGGVIKFAPNVKTWVDALKIAALNYTTQIVECAFAGGAVGLLGAFALGELVLAVPTFASVFTNLGIMGATKVLTGYTSYSNKDALGEIHNSDEGWKAASPEYEAATRIYTNGMSSVTGSDVLLLFSDVALPFLNVKVPGAKAPAPVTEPTAAEPVPGGKPAPEPVPEDPLAPKEPGTPEPPPEAKEPEPGTKTEEQAREEQKAKEEEGAPVEGEGAEAETGKSGGNGEAYEDPKPPRSEKPKSGTPEHKAARWEKYLKEHPNDAKSYKEWSNRYDANMKNPGKGNKSADAYQKEIGWGDREVPMKIDENGNIVQTKKGQESRNLDIADVGAKKAVEVKDYSSTKVPYSSKEMKAEVAFDKKLVEDGWDVEWVFKDKGPSTGLEEALNAPPPIKIKILK